MADDFDAAETLRAIDAPLALVYGTRDSTAKWKPFSRAAEEIDARVVSLEADHFFVGQSTKVAEAIGGFIADLCDEMA